MIVQRCCTLVLLVFLIVPVANGCGSKSGDSGDSPATTADAGPDGATSMGANGPKCGDLQLCTTSSDYICSGLACAGTTTSSAGVSIVNRTCVGAGVTFTCSVSACTIAGQPSGTFGCSGDVTCSAAWGGGEAQCAAAAAALDGGEQQQPDAGSAPQSAVSFALTVGAVTGFEPSEDMAVASGTTQMCNPNTTVVVELNTTDPISGAQTLRIRFDYRNETTAWQQWSFVRLALKAAPQDLSALTGVRFKARSDQARDVRLDLIGPTDLAGQQTANFGWDISLTTSTQTVEVRFADAGIPSWASNPGTTLADILAQTTALSFQPLCNGRDSSGQLPAGTSDSGWTEMDDVEFF